TSGGRKGLKRLSGSAARLAFAFQSIPPLFSLRVAASAQRRALPEVQQKSEIAFPAFVCSRRAGRWRRHAPTSGESRSRRAICPRQSSFASNPPLAAATSFSCCFFPLG